MATNKELEKRVNELAETNKEILSLLQSIKKPENEVVVSVAQVQDTVDSLHNSQEINVYENKEVDGFLVRTLGGEIKALNQSFNSIFEKYFDWSDGFVGRMTEPTMSPTGRESGNWSFVIVVPEKFSNASDAHKQFYRDAVSGKYFDVRRYRIGLGNSFELVESFCKQVAKNLHYTRSVR